MQAAITVTLLIGTAVAVPGIWLIPIDALLD
jgi:hypothetical protein